MSQKRVLYWRLCIAGAVALSILTFTPLVTPDGRIEPMLAGVPYTLWTSMLVMVGFVLLTWIGARVHPRSDRERGS